MEDFTLSHRRYVNSGQRIGIIDDKAYAVNNIYVVRAHHHFPTTSRTTTDMNNMPSHKYHISKTSTYQPENRPWYSTPELKRKKRVAKYKLYSMEGKVKKSFKNGYRWFKHTCSRIIHGF